MTHHRIEQNTDQWLELRLGRITASKAHCLFMSPTTEGYKDYAFQVAYERIYRVPFPERWSGNAETEKGHEREREAIAEYQRQEFVKVEPGGFWCDEKIGASPDGLIGENGLIEVKSIIVGKQFRKFVDDGKKPQTAHLEQCLFQLYVTNRQWCDLVYYPPIPEPKLIIHRIEQTDDEMNRFREAIEKFEKGVNEIFL